MNSKKLNLFALFMMIVMCAVTIFVSVGRKDNDSAVTDEILSIYKKIEKLDKKIDENQGDSAYELAVKEGYTGNINEWLASLKGSDGENKVANITANDLYQAYLVKSGKTEVEYSYEDFLKEMQPLGALEVDVPLWQVDEIDLPPCESANVAQYMLIENLLVKKNTKG